MPLLIFFAALFLAQVGTASSVDTGHEGGRQIYNYRCYYCHGYSGDAKTLAATFMEPPPRNFVALQPGEISRLQMIDAVTHGRLGTAMKSFTYYLSTEEIAQVVDFIRREFVEQKRINTRYHTQENGWPDHQRYRAAYPFATGELALDMDQQKMSESQRGGFVLYMGSCISCHDRAQVYDEGDIWQSRSVSYPRNNFSYTTPPESVDAYSGASVYARHDIVPETSGLTEQQQQGERLYQQNCSFCHAADGTGENWIGSFLESRPRNLADGPFMKSITKERLRTVILQGLQGTSMPAWKNVLDESQVDAISAYVLTVLSPLTHPVR